MVLSPKKQILGYEMPIIGSPPRLWLRILDIPAHQLLYIYLKPYLVDTSILSKVRILKFALNSLMVYFFKADIWIQVRLDKVADPWCQNVFVISEVADSWNSVASFSGFFPQVSVEYTGLYCGVASTTFLDCQAFVVLFLIFCWRISLRSRLLEVSRRLSDFLPTFNCVYSTSLLMSHQKSHVAYKSLSERWYLFLQSRHLDVSQLSLVLLPTFEFLHWISLLISCSHYISIPIIWFRSSLFADLFT